MSRVLKINKVVNDTTIKVIAVLMKIDP